MFKEIRQGEPAGVEMLNYLMHQIFTDVEDEGERIAQIVCLIKDEAKEQFADEDDAIFAAFIGGLQYGLERMIMCIDGICVRGNSPKQVDIPKRSNENEAE